MNSLVERLRQYALPDPHDEREVMHAPLLKETADLIEQQAARIAELEAWRDSWVKCPEGAAAQRIKELEQQRDEWKAEAIYLRGLSAETVAGQELAIVKQQRDELLAAAENLVKVKGRHHTEQAYKQLKAAVAKVSK